MLKTRKPTGLAPFPFMLVAGVEKAGKSFLIAQFTKSGMVGRSFWIEVGETSADQYGSVGDYEIVEHDGSFTSILEQVKACVSEPTVDGKPNAIVIDSITAIWDLLCEEQQIIADRKNGRITVSQWGQAKLKWRRLINELKKHNGPVFVTSRLDQVTDIVDGGKPGDLVWKIRAEKNLPFEVDGIIELRAHRTYTIKGLRSVAAWAENETTRERNLDLAALIQSLRVAGAPRNDVPIKHEVPEPADPTPLFPDGGDAA